MTEERSQRSATQRQADALNGARESREAAGDRRRRLQALDDRRTVKKAIEEHDAGVPDGTSATTRVQADALLRARGLL